MKTKTNISKPESSIGGFIKRGSLVSKSAYIINSICLMFVLLVNTSAQVQQASGSINISGTKFTYPLLEKWASEYAKEKPEVKINIVKNPTAKDKLDIKVIAHSLSNVESLDNQLQIKVSRYALLPVVNEKNKAFEKQFKKGLKTIDFRDIFVDKAVDWSSNPDEEETKKVNYTVYTKNPGSCSAITLGNFFGKPGNTLNGKIVTGDDNNLISAVLRDSTGVTFNNLGYIFDKSNRELVKGLKIVPLDLNNNGKLDKDEQIYTNLDQVITYLENSKENSVPVDYVSFIVDSKSNNLHLVDFVEWVRTKGQEYSHQYGFLTNDDKSENALTQK